MLGFIFTILGGYTVYRLWDDSLTLAIITIVLTIYQASTLFNMNRNVETRWEIILNLVASLAILGIFITSFFI
ncbi:hypothetical protein J45TS6_45590 [Paenibacillus sp. J45TS6]|nr:hypothetical protein [Paenibacillus sp.]GIP46100.1 hypothetical protein J45TS6_45590 [Paenibacillus sp. J45TS6]